MANRAAPRFLRRRLGRRLRQLREQSGLNLEEAAPKLDKTRSALSRVENGDTPADVHLVRSMMDVYQLYDDTLVDLAREAAKRGWWSAYGIVDQGYIDLETEASRVLDFQVINIPGLLQTEFYMRALFKTGRRRTHREMNNDVAVRLIRRKRLTDGDRPLDHVAIVAESVLHCEVGGTEVMRGQLQHLVQMAALPRVTLQVLPNRQGMHDGMNGAFTLLEFPQADDPDMLYVEHIAGALHIEKAEPVQAARLVMESLRSQALPPDDSVALVERMLADLYGPQR